MKRPLLLAGILALTPACAHANAGLARTPVAQTPAYNGTVAAAGAASLTAGFIPALSAGASFLSNSSRGLTISEVVDAVNAYTAMAFANVKATFFVPGSAEAFVLADHPDIQAAVAKLPPAAPMPVRQRPQVESMRGPARPSGEAEQTPQAPSADDIQTVEASAPRVAADSVRMQLTNLGGRLKGLPTAADVDAALAEVDHAFTGRSPS